MTLPHRIRRQDGFTLPEVMAVIVILGILAALVYTVFLGQDQSAMDAEAKSNARSLLWKVQTCFTATEDYTLCDEPTEQEPPAGSDAGATTPVRSRSSAAGPTRRATRSRSARSHGPTSDGVNHIFTIVKEVDGTTSARCDTDAADDAGGCNVRRLVVPRSTLRERPRSSGDRAQVS